MHSTIHTLTGWREIDTSPAALLADALATEADHADYLYRRFAEHALCAWQRQPVMAGPEWDDLPDDAPGSDDPDTGPSERHPFGLHTCPATGRAYPDGVARRAVGGGSVIWTWCPWCDSGDGNPQPHPFEVRHA